MMKQMHYHSHFPRGSFVPWLHLVFFKLLYAISDSILDSFHKEIYLSDAIAFPCLLTLAVFGKGVIYPQRCFTVENVEEVNPKKGENSYWGINALSSLAGYVAEAEPANTFKPGFSLPLLPQC